MSRETTVALAVIALLYLWIGFLLWLIPDLRRDLAEYLRPAAIAKRIDAWVQRNQRR